MSEVLGRGCHRRILRLLKSTTQYSQDMYQPVSLLALGRFCAGYGHFLQFDITNGISNSSFALPRNFPYTCYERLFHITIICYGFHFRRVTQRIRNKTRKSKAEFICDWPLKPKFSFMFWFWSAVAASCFKNRLCYQAPHIVMEMKEKSLNN